MVAARAGWPLSAARFAAGHPGRAEWCARRSLTSTRKCALSRARPAASLFRLQFVLLPGFKTAIHLHHRKALAGETHTRIGREMTLLRVTINDVRAILLEAFRIIPASFWKIDGSRNMCLGVVL